MCNSCQTRCGCNNSCANAIARALENGDRTLVPDIAPPQALYLEKVEYI